MKLPQRFWDKVRKGTSGCWIWTASGNHGYGYFWFEGKSHRAHRLSYAAVHGSMPTGPLDHTCGNRLCVNPDHLEQVTTMENNRRSQCVSTVNAAKTHCPRGHRYDTTSTSSKGTYRRCKKCHADWARAKSVKQQGEKV